MTHMRTDWTRAEIAGKHCGVGAKAGEDSRAIEVDDRDHRRCAGNLADCFQIGVARLVVESAFVLDAACSEIGMKQLVRRGEAHDRSVRLIGAVDDGKTKRGERLGCEAA